MTDVELFYNCKTMNDWFSLLNNPKVDLFQLLEDVSDKKSKTFCKVGNVRDFLPDHISLLNNKIISTEKNKILPSEQERFSQHNYDYGYQEYAVTDSFNKLSTFCGFFNEMYTINLQKTSQQKVVHYDSCVGWIKRYKPDWASSKFDHASRQPSDMPKLHRFLVAIDDWQPGQIMMFGHQSWTNWKRGDIITFDWVNVPHATANCSFFDRPILKITCAVDKETTNLQNLIW